MCYGIYYLFGYWENEGTAGKIECWNGFWFLVFLWRKVCIFFFFLGFVSIWSLGLITGKAEGNWMLGINGLLWLVGYFITVEMCTYLDLSISSHLFGCWERAGKRWIAGFFFFFHAFCFFSIKKKRFSVKHTYSGFLLANPLWFGCLWECKRMEDSGILGLMVHSVFVFSNFPHFHCDLISKVSKVFFKINSCVLFFFFYKALTKFLSWFFFFFSF